jgi:hypothetical protein
MIRRHLILLSSVAVVLAIAGGAFAYWTTTGAGTGTSTNAAGTGALTLTAAWAGGLAPGVSLPVTFTANNASATTSVKIGTVTSVVSVDAPHVACALADITVAPVVSGQTIPKTSGAVALTNLGSIVFADTGVSQDACKGAVITLTVSSN